MIRSFKKTCFGVIRPIFKTIPTLFYHLIQQICPIHSVSTLNNKFYNFISILIPIFKRFNIFHCCIINIILHLENINLIKTLIKFCCVFTMIVFWFIYREYGQMYIIIIACAILFSNFIYFGLLNITKVDPTNTSIISKQQILITIENTNKIILDEISFNYYFMANAAVIDAETSSIIKS